MKKINLAKDKNPYSWIFGRKMTLRGKKRKSEMTIAKDWVEPAPTEKQLTARKNFRDASDYANSVSLIPELKALYEERCGKGTSVYTLAITDYFRLPEVTAIKTEDYRGHTGDKILVKAYDLIGVTRVVVRINDASGTLVEEGECVYTPRGNAWVYTATVDLESTAGLTVIARAHDHPDNRVEKSVTL